MRRGGKGAQRKSEEHGDVSPKSCTGKVHVHSKQAHSYFSDGSLTPPPSPDNLAAIHTVPMQKQEHKEGVSMLAIVLLW